MFAPWTLAVGYRAHYCTPRRVLEQHSGDPIVPPNQSRLIADALRARNVPLAYVLYSGEGHGFRKPQNIINSKQSELSFYGQVFGFTPADTLPKLTIEGFPAESREAR